MSEKLDIVLCCSAGMSTSLVVEKMQDAAKEKGIDVEIKAVPVSSVEDFDSSHKIDILLLGPQVKFKLNELKEVYKDQNTLVDVINMMDYGMINGEKILTDALKAYKKQYQSRKTQVDTWVFLCQLLDFYKPKTIPRPAPARMIQRGLRFLNLNKTKLKPAKRAIGIGIIRERRFPVCLKVSGSKRVMIRTVDMAPRIRPAVAGLSVVKASATVFEFLKARIILAIIKIIIMGPVTRDKVARMPPIGP